MNLEQLIGILKIGHEIEFTYKGERYSITDTQKGICLTQYYDLKHQVYKNLEHLINKH
jgi:hypothetical protein